MVVYCFGVAFHIYHHSPHFALANRPDRPMKCLLDDEDGERDGDLGGLAERAVRCLHGIYALFGRDLERVARRRPSGSAKIDELGIGELQRQR